MSLQHPKYWVHSGLGLSLSTSTMVPGTTIGSSVPGSATSPSSSASPNYLGGGGNIYNDIWGGYVVHPSAVNGFNNFYLVQGAWVQQSYNGKNDAHTISDWVGLGGTDGTTLYQTGTYLIQPGCGYPWCAATYGFFWETYPNTLGYKMVIISSPSVTSGDTVASVVWEYYNSTEFEACNETQSACSWTSWNYQTDYASDTGEWIVEDASTNGVLGANDPPYAPVYFGPNSTSINENFVDDRAHNYSLLMQWLPADIHEMGVWRSGGPSYMAPGTVASNTLFDMCPGTYPGSLPTWC